MQARRARPPNTLVTTTSTQATNVTSQSAGFAGALFHGDGIQVGTIKEDLYPYGLGGTYCMACESIVHIFVIDPTTPTVFEKSLGKLVSYDRA
ncbi:hypothetical protein P5673_015398 [Acropora cervicornis]|uniref:Uncharacterized protein n=1 Tax=Acropora cervicornis TaxID=6130 RepID=A0AAD9QII2_ACRCE|nr:hypothetical protein P5673_015398 [Acropora cervicornis]